MTEDFLTYIWKNKLFQNTDMLWEGENLEILFNGELNTDAGPDFTNAKIKIGNTVWAGNLEIHCNSSDWYRHNHDKNHAFDNVILHVVSNHDCEVYTSKGRKIPSIEIKYKPHFWENYYRLMHQEKWIPCADKISQVDSLVITSWISTLAVERLSEKTSEIEKNHEALISNWEEIFYKQLTKSFGFHVNTLPFELLTTTLTYKTLQKCQNDIIQTEALLLGTAGFLNDDYLDEPYYCKLKKEFYFLQNKYNIKPIDSHLWKFLRLRPGNFPIIRLAQLAALIKSSESLLPDILNADTPEKLRRILIHPLSEFWNTHYSFHHPSEVSEKMMGKDSADTIIINTIIPFLFIYGRFNAKPELEDRALQLLEQLPPEKNSVINNWKQCGVKAKNAFDTQALLQLKNKYCDKKRCVNCRLGTAIISGNA
jgi:hypothetical protein